MTVLNFHPFLIEISFMVFGMAPMSKSYLNAFPFEPYCTLLSLRNRVFTALHRWASTQAKWNAGADLSGLFKQLDRLFQLVCKNRRFILDLLFTRTEICVLQFDIDCNIDMDIRFCCTPIAASWKSICASNCYFTSVPSSWIYYSVIITQLQLVNHFIARRSGMILTK